MATIALCATLLAATAACKKDPPPAAPAAPVAVQVGPENVVAVTMQDISTGPLISGTLAAEKDARVRAEVSGSILQVTAAEGQNVRRGALLARIEDQALGDAYKSAQSAVKSAEQALGVAEREAARTESLVKGGALAERELDVARNAVTAAQAQLEDARSRLAAAAKQLANLTIRSPLDGVVAERLGQRRRRRRSGHRAVSHHRSAQHAARGVRAVGSAVGDQGRPAGAVRGPRLPRPALHRPHRADQSCGRSGHPAGVDLRDHSQRRRPPRCRPVRRRACLPAGPPRAGRAAHRREHLGPEGAVGAAGRGRQGGTRHGGARAAR